MFGNGLMSWLRPSAETAVPESKWDPATLTMHPTSASHLSAEHIVTEQPHTGESMQLQIRGGGEGEDVCCGVCAGLCCFECCECCCGGDDGPPGPPGPP